MTHTARSVGTARAGWLALIVALAGCGQVLGIDDWQQAGIGGAGGEPATVTTGSAGSGQGGTQTASAASGSTSSGMTGNEVCNNGMDDDADGDVDCADSDCSAYTCSPDVPPNWIGPVAIYVGDANSAPPSCGAKWTSETDFLTGTLTAPDAQCSPCGCGAPAGGQCNLVPTSGLSFYKDSTCMTLSSTTTATANQCAVALSVPGDVISAFKVTGAAYALGGACGPTGGAPTLPPAYFDKVARVCSGPAHGEGCGAGVPCVPPPPPSFRPSLCIYRQVNDELNPMCPLGYSPLPMLYKTIADMRTCSSCQCGNPAARTCEVTARVYGNSTMCTGGAVQTLDYCNAVSMPGAVTMRFQIDPGVPMGGGCSSLAPSLPMGQANGTARTLACCLQ